MNDDNTNADAVRVIGIMQKKGWTEGDIASLADYIDRRSRARMQPLEDRINSRVSRLYWSIYGGFVVLAILVMVAPELTRRLADRLIFG